jgi:outer membrane receptor protein involved in Fe transport
VNSIVSASGGSPSTVGLRLPQVARHQFSLQANWTSRKWGSVLLQARGTSSQFDDDQNVFGLRGYAVVGGMYSRSLDPNVDIYAAIENAFNTRIEAGRTPVLTLGQPRTARIGLRIRLGRGR